MWLAGIIKLSFFIYSQNLSSKSSCHFHLSSYSPLIITSCAITDCCDRFSCRRGVSRRLGNSRMLTPVVYYPHWKILAYWRDKDTLKYQFESTNKSKRQFPIGKRLQCHRQQLEISFKMTVSRLTWFTFSLMAGMPCKCVKLKFPFDDSIFFTLVADDFYAALSEFNGGNKTCWNRWKIKKKNFGQKIKLVFLKVV